MGILHQAYMIKKLLECNGFNCAFSRIGKDYFGEDTKEEEVCNCKGLYHESNGYLSITLKEAGKVSTEKQPKLLVLYTTDLKNGDTVAINGSKYKVIGIDDLGNLRLCLDLSLEVV